MKDKISEWMKKAMNYDFEKDIIQKLKDELVQQGRIAEIPEGYSWCMNCNGLTPHDKPEKSWHEVGECIICGDQPLGELCPNCAWDAEEIIENSHEHEEVLHHDGCHCKNEEYPGKIFYISWAKMIANEFKKDWMKPSPDRTSWSFSGRPEYKEIRNQYYLNQKLKDQWISARDVKCGCPRYIIYNIINTFDHWGHSVYSMDCMDAREWGFKIRCPKCGCIWDYEDGNC